jgi:hypothetical protein
MSPAPKGTALYGVDHYIGSVVGAEDVFACSVPALALKVSTTEENYPMRICSLMTCVLIATLCAGQFANAGMSPSKKQKALEKAHYAEYVGKQQDWPKTDKATINIQHNKYGIPIYHDLPNKAYEVLGTIQTGGNSAVKYAAEAAQALGGDAILVCKHQSFEKAGIELQPSIGLRGSSSAKVDILQGILIRWKKE